MFDFLLILKIFNSMIIRKGNVLLEKKIDKLEEVAERLQAEKWELFTIKARRNEQIRLNYLM